MPDRVFYPLTALVVIGLIALAGVWPQGQGARSPKPFGHAPWAQSHPKDAAKLGDGAAPLTKGKSKGPR